jgi:MFS family permease
VPPDLQYRRDGVTLTGFALLAVWACFVYLVGPVSVAAREDFGLSDAQAGLIGTAFAAGLMGSGVVGPVAVRRFGRRGALVVMLAALAACVALLALAPGYVAVLLAVLGAGLTGAVVANTATAVLSDHQGGHRARAITEGNAVGAWVGLLSPAVVAVFLTTRWGWQGAVWLTVALPLVVLPLVVARLAPGPSPGAAAGPASPRHPLPSGFWVSLVCVAMAVAAEFSLTFWAAPLIVEGTGAPLASATGALSATVLGVALGRTFAARLPGRFGLPGLLAAGFCLLAVAMAALLLAPTFPAAVAALLLCGLGISVLFPFAQSLALTLAADQADRAVAIVALAIGVAIGAAPFLLGVLAEAVGLRPAFVAAFGTAAAGLVAALAVGRLAAPARRP